MLYVMDKGLQKIALDHFDVTKITLGMVSLCEFESLHSKLGICEESVWECMKPSLNFRSAYSICNDYMFSTFHMVDVSDIMASNERIAIFMKHNICLIVRLSDEIEKVESCFQKAIKRMECELGSMERFLYLFFSAITYEDNKVLEDIEFELDLLEETIVAKNVSEEFHYELLAKKRELYVLRNYYEQMVEFTDLLLDNELEMFEESQIKYLRMLYDKLGRLKSNTLILRESLFQLREAYQSFLDYSLNSIMKVFTVVTTIFSPLSLVVGWYGMNFESMPEFAWRYGYLFVITLSVAVLVLCFLFFKKRKLI